MGDQNAQGGNAAVKGRVVKLGELAGYQDGAVVSLEIMKGKAGSVTVFAFDEGEGLSEHTAPFDAMVVVLEGRVEVTIDDEPLEVGEGEAVIMPADHPHALKALARFKMLLVLLRE